MISNSNSREVSLMELAIELAMQSRPSPNPRVGAVVYKQDEIIGQGFHEKPGAPHAEVIALAEAGEAARGADLYVTLEPCSHTGRTGPCTEVILKAGIARVFVGMVDPDPRVHGAGIEKLRNAGVEVNVGPARESCEQMLREYAYHRTTGLPFVTLKAAVTLDGYLAATTGDSKWISGEESRKKAHAMRARADAVLVGVGTVIRDDPSLTVRSVEGPNPLPIVLDSTLRTPLGSKILTSAKENPVLLVHAGASAESIERCERIPGVETLKCASTDEKLVDLNDLIEKLGSRGILSMLVEGGAQIHGSFARAKLAQEVALFIAPRILGSGRPWVLFDGVKSIADGLAVQDPTITKIGDDFLYQGSLGGEL